MTINEKKVKIDYYFDRAKESTLNGRGAQALMYLGTVLGILETIDSVGVSTTAYRQSVLERVRIASREIRLMRTL